MPPPSIAAALPPLEPPFGRSAPYNENAMSTVETPTLALTAVGGRRRFTIDEWHRMVEAGVFREEDRIELIEGDVYEMTPIGRRHFSTVARINRLFNRRLGDRAIVHVRGPVPVPPRSEPYPDVALLHEVADFYAETPLTPDNVYLVVEVADTSLRYDRAKLEIYAAAGITEVWIVNLPDGVLEVYRSPEGNRYRDSRVLRRGETILPLAFADLAIGVDEIFG
jgi:Uma2 family endonuclease